MQLTNFCFSEIMFVSLLVSELELKTHALELFLHISIMYVFVVVVVCCNKYPDTDKRVLFSQGVCS